MREQLFGVALAIAGLTVVAAVSAPAAQARPTCQDSVAGQQVCRTSGSVAIKAKPGTKAPPANQPVYPWLGAGIGGAG